MVMTAPHDQQKPLAKKYVLDCMYSPFTKITFILTLPLPLWSSLSELSEVLFPRLQSSFCPKKTYLTTFMLYTFFFQSTEAMHRWRFKIQNDISEILRSFAIRKPFNICLTWHFAFDILACQKRHFGRCWQTQVDSIPAQ